MRKLLALLTPLLIVALVLTAAGCGSDDDDEPTPAPTQTASPTQVEETPTPSDGTPTPSDGTSTPPVYTGGKETFKVSHSSSPGTFDAIMWELMNEQLQLYTDGRCKMEIYPASSLYRGLEEWDAIATGGVDMIKISDWMPQMQGMMDWILGYYPYFWGTDHFNAWEHDKRFMEHPDGGGRMMLQLEDRGIKGVGLVFGSGLTMNVSGKGEMDSQADMEGWKAYSVGGMSDLIVHTVPAKPVFLDPAESSIALEQGLVDVIFADPSRVLTQKLYEPAPYGLVSSVVAPHSVISMNLDKWNSLTPDLQVIFTDYIIPEANAYYRDVVMQDYLDGIDILQEEHGMIIHWMSLDERADFRDRAFAKAAELGYTDLLEHPEMLELADKLREEPYDQGHFFP